MQDKNEIASNMSLQGTCLEMCPLEEENLRIKEEMVHVLEVTSTGRKLVKMYSRSAADANMALPHCLRPFPVLLKTIQYLLFETSKRKDVKKWVLYDFVDDRLRAVRQDMTVQRLPPDQCTVLLEPMIRFYVYYGYRLCECAQHEFDPVLNQKHLVQCLKLFLSSCSVMDTTKEYSPVDNITYRMQSLDIGRQQLAVDRILVECLYILCNLDDPHPLYRYLQLPATLKRISALKLAYDIGVTNLRGNFVRITRLSRRLCPLTFAALCSYLPKLQKKSLETLSHAYNSRQLTVPVPAVRGWLMMESADEAAATCRHYGLTVDRGVLFNKGAFKHVAVPQRRRGYSAKIVHLKLEDVLSYTL